MEETHKLVVFPIREHTPMAHRNSPLSDLMYLHQRVTFMPLMLKWSIAMDKVKALGPMVTL
jgi:hypothetical protein